ncbi:MAG: S1/P1 nuclease [Bacteriovoracaceae bacterium]|nr:S1/P1 nuclease [Bacteriovoracaceae bacterium]
MKRLSSILALILCFHTQTIFAWGAIGHKVVGEVATQYLKKDAKFLKELKLMLENEDLADVSNWADFIKSDPTWSLASTWHYVTIEDNETYETATHNKSGDVVEAINRFYKELKNPKLSRVKHKEALSFLVHFVGDIHQPLHVGRGSDQGGNTIRDLIWLGRKTNLHAIWDEHLIEMEKLSYREYSDYLIRKFGNKKREFETKDVLEWAKESKDIRPIVYSYEGLTAKSSFAYDYRFRVRDTMNLQLFKAGVRLAYILNRAL